jgi:hypothetical protein
MLLGKTEFEFTWLDTNYDYNITIDEWTAGKESENSFLTVKNNDTADCFETTVIEATVGNSSYNDWYDENLDGMICWDEWISYDIDQNQWTLLDVDGNDYLDSTELNATNIDPSLILQWLDSNGDDLIEWDEYVVGMIGMNQFDSVS